MLPDKLDLKTIVGRGRRSARARFDYQGIGIKTVFISYSQKDKEVAATVRAALKAESDIKVSIDGVTMATRDNISALID